MASCFPTGSNVPLSADQIIDSPCANGLLFNYTYNFTANSSLINRVKFKRPFKRVYKTLLTLK